MKHPKLFFLLLLIIVLFLTSCVGIKGNSKEKRIEPNPVLTTNWSSKQYKELENRHHNEYFIRETIDCVTSFDIEGDYYKFFVCSATDTVEISVHKSYIGSDVDSICIMIDRAVVSSEIGVHPDCSWVRLGKIKVLAGGFYTEYCKVRSTIPVYVNVFLIVSLNRDNVNPSYNDLIKSKMQLYSDSASQHLQKIIRDIKE